MPRAKAASKQEPRIIEMPSQTMAVVRTTGEPDKAAEKAMPALYGAVYTLKFALKKKGVDFKVGAPRARWPNAHLAPKEQWQAIWGLPIPDDTASLQQKSPDVPVTIERWDYGTVAEILHRGPYSEEQATVQRLHAFIADSGYEIAGAHEEEYLTRPTAKVPKTIIRYLVKKKK